MSEAEAPTRPASDGTPPRNVEVVIQRWWVILILALAGATALLATQGLVQQAASWVFEQSGVGPSWYGIPVIFGALFAAAASLRRSRALPVQGRVLARLCYPSTWVAGLLGTVALLAANVCGHPEQRCGCQVPGLTTSDCADDDTAEQSHAPKAGAQWLRRVDAWPSSIDEAVWCSLMTLALGVPAAAAAADWGARWLRWFPHRWPKREPVGQQDKAAESELDFWLQPEGHDANGEDRLERKAIADRIATRLRAGRGAIELYGAFGSGKTTVLRMVAAEVDQTLDESGRTVVVVRLSAWPKDTQAAHMVLTKLLDTAGCYVDVARVGGLADAFREAMNATDHWLLKMLHALTRGGDDYQQQLAALDTALGAVRVHVVLMLEDLDRAEGTTPLQVETMLDALKTMQNVSYVVAIGRLGAPN